MDSQTDRIYGDPYETAGGTTIITVSRVRPGRRGDTSMASPVGLFVVRDGAVTWSPAVDVTRIVLLGEVIGLLAAVIATSALLRRPPWPDLSRRGSTEVARWCKSQFPRTLSS